VNLPQQAPQSSGIQSHAPNPLVEAAVKPLSGNAEQRLTAISILAETADPAHPDAEKAIRRWEEIDRKKFPSLRTILLFVAAVAALGFMVFLQIPEIELFSKLVEPGFFSPPMEDLSNLSPQRKLLFSIGSEDDQLQSKALYLSDTTNPAYYAEYAIRHPFGLPEDYLETVTALAPRNSFFLYLASGVIDNDAVNRKPKTGPSDPRRIVEGVELPALPVERDYEINDQAAYENSLALLEKAALLPDFDPYGSTMIGERIRALPSEDTYLWHLTGMLAIYSGTSGTMPLRKSAEVLCARAQQLSRVGDTEGFLKLAKIRNHLIQAMANNPDADLVDALVFHVVAMNTAEYFAYSAERLGLSKEAERFRIDQDRLREANDRRQIRQAKSWDTLYEDRGSMMTAFNMSMVADHAEFPPPLTLENLAPLRNAEHLVAMRAGLVVVACAMLVACLPLYFFRHLFPVPLRSTAARVVKLLTFGDYVIAFTLGTVLPISGILLISSIASLNGREWSATRFLFLFPGVHLAATLLVALLAPAIFIRLRLSKRLAPLGIPCPPGLLSILALLLVVGLAVAAYPVVRMIGFDRPVLAALVAAPAFWLAVVSYNILRALTEKPARRIALAATSMSLLPIYAASILTIPLAFPFYLAAEKRWIVQDTLYRLDPDAPDFGQYEFRLAAQKRLETRAILGLDNYGRIK